MSSNRSLTLFGAVLQREITGERILSVLGMAAKDDLAEEFKLDFNDIQEVDDGLTILDQIKQLALSGSIKAQKFYLDFRSNRQNQNWQIEDRLYHDLGEVAFHTGNVALLLAFYEDSVLYQVDLFRVHVHRHSPDVARGFQALKLAAMAGDAGANLMLTHLTSAELSLHVVNMATSVHTLSDHYRDFIALHGRLVESDKNKRAQLTGTISYAEVGSTRAIHHLIEWYTQGNVSLGVVVNEQEAERWRQIEARLSQNLRQCFKKYSERGLNCLIQFSTSGIDYRKLHQWLTTRHHFFCNNVEFVPTCPSKHDYFKDILLKKANAGDVHAMHFLATQARTGRFPYLCPMLQDAKLWYQKILDTIKDISPVTACAGRALYEMYDENDVAGREELLLRAALSGCLQSMKECAPLTIHQLRKLGEPELAAKWDSILIRTGLISSDELSDLIETTKEALGKAMPVKRLRVGN